VDDHAKLVIGSILAAGAFILMAAIAVFAWFDNRRIR